MDPGTHRSQYFVSENSTSSFLEKVISFGKSYQDRLNSAQKTIFDDFSEVSIPEPTMPFSEPWSSIYRLNKEKEVVGVFLSGHPLDDFRIEIDSFCRGSINTILNRENHEGRDLMIAAVVTDSEHRVTRRGDAFGTMTIEDYNDSFRLNLWKENYLKFKHFMEPGTFIIVKGRIEKTRDRHESEFVVYGMELLQGFRDKKARNIELKISSNALDENMLGELKSLLLSAESTGKCRVNFMIYDSLDEIQVKLPSRTISVNPSNEFFKKLENLDIDYRLN